MTPNVSNSAGSTRPAGSNWNLPAVRASGTPVPQTDGAGTPAPGNTPNQDTIEIKNRTPLPSLAVITQRIITEMRAEAKDAEKKTDERRAQEASDRRDQEVRQREQQAQERKQQDAKIDAAQEDARRSDARTKPAPSGETRDKSDDASPKPGDARRPSLRQAREQQAEAAKQPDNSAAPPPPKLAVPPADDAHTPTPAVQEAAEPHSAGAPSANPSELLHTITSQLSNSSLEEMSSVHLLRVDFQS